MRLHSFCTPHQIVIAASDGGNGDGERMQTGTLQVGTDGVESIEALGGGVVVVQRKVGRALVITPSGYGFAENAADPQAPPKRKK